MKGLIIAGAAAVAVYFLLQKRAVASQGGQIITDTTGRQLFLHEFDGQVLDQFGGQWT